MNNTRIRNALFQNNTKYWQLARIMGVSEATLSRRLRDELPDDEQARIVRLIEREAAKNEEASNN